MTFAAVTLLGMTVGQPLGPDIYPMNSRTIKLPIEYKPGKNRKDIRNVWLYVARNGENTWYAEACVTPDKDSFVYVAKDDGLYWFKMQLVDLKGNKDPAELTGEPADLKMVIDTVAPQVRFTNARRSGEEVVVEWSVEDKFPNDAETKVHFRLTDSPESYWREVTVPANSRNGVKFPCKTNDGITVKVTAVDIAGNRTEVTKDFPAAGTTALSPPGPTPPNTTSTGAYTPPAPVDVIPIGTGGPMSPVGPAPVYPTAAPLAPVVGPASGVVTPAVVPAVPPPTVQPVTPPMPAVGYVSPQPPVAGGVGSPAPVVSYQPQPQPQPPVGTGGVTPLPTVDLKAPVGAAPAASAEWVGSGTVPAPAETVPAQIIGYPRFDLGYDLEQRGPSGISRVLLFVTRDEGKSWYKWSEHDGKGGIVRVKLDVRDNPQQLEGSYGFRLVPVSGAGRSEKEPAAGEAPDMRVVLDVTPPKLLLFPPESDKDKPDTLVIRWQATDRNFGDDPITLEWSDARTGPWRPVATTGTDPVVQATAITAPVAKRLPNTGQYAWRVPAGVPAHVYLKATARDAAGNVTELATFDPIPVDLTKPRAKISGIVPPPVTPRP